MTIKTDSELGVFSLNEERNRQIDEALIKNKEKTKKIGGVAAVTSDLGSMMKDRVDKFRKAGDNVFGNLEIIKNKEIKHKFEQAFANFEKIFLRINLITPTPERFEKSGVDFEYLAKEFERMEQEGLMPAIVISPVMRLDSLLLDASNPLPLPNQTWTELYSILAKKDPPKVNPLLNKSSYSGLFLNSRTGSKKNYYEEQFQRELDFVNNSDYIHSVSDNDGPIWTIALIPSTKIPKKLHTPYTNFERPDDTNSSEHITVSQYLSLQINRIQSDEAPIDQVIYRTWLQGSTKIGSSEPEAPYGYWHDIGNRVMISYERCSFLHYYYGVRLPVWG